MRLSTKLILLFLLIISISIALISWQGLRYFISDKETYVQDINAQNLVVLSNSLADRVTTIGEKLQRFSEFVEYRFADHANRDKALRELQSECRQFLSIAFFRVSSGSVKQGLALYNDEGLKLARTSRRELRGQRFILSHYKDQTEKLRFQNFTKNAAFPVVLISYKKNKKFVLALIPQRALMNIVAKKSIYTAFVVDGRGSLIMDQDPANLMTGKSKASHPMVEKVLKDEQRKISGGTGEYIDEDTSEEMLGSWAHIGDTGLGLVVEMPKKLAYLAARELLRKLAIWIVLIFGMAVIVTLFFSSTITKPLKDLARFASRVGKGDFSVELPKKTNDELGDLVKTFNTMNLGLKERDAQIEEKNKQLVQSEKMSAFGQMSAGIAHEVKNPLAGILGYTQIAKKKAPPEANIKNYLDIIEKETKRCKDIVENLMKFARAEKAVFDDIDIVQVVRDSVALVDHQITISGIKIERKFPEEGVKFIVRGNANQITQVLTNIMLNAQYAMKKKGEGGTLSVGVTPPERGFIKIVLEDTGIGIKEENISKLFDPFFTTKPSGEGTGLGLSVSYGIIKDHKGDIRVESKLGEWTRFTVDLPVKET